MVAFDERREEITKLFVTLRFAFLVLFLGSLLTVEHNTKTQPHRLGTHREGLRTGTDLSEEFAQNVWLRGGEQLTKSER